MPRMFLGGVPRERAGDERLAWRRLGLKPSESFRLRSEAFDEGQPIPVPFSAEGGSHRPPVSWSGIPDGTRSLVLLVEDPDAPTPNPFVHWILFNIPPSVTGSGDALTKEAKIGRNSLMSTGWTGCAPPKGDEPHRYIFQLFALDRELSVGDHPGRTMLVNAMRGHVLGFTMLTGTFRR